MTTYQVELVFEGETDVWMTADAFDAIADHDGSQGQIVLDDPGKGLLRKIKYYSGAGFGNFEYGKGAPVKHEGNGVYRVGYGDLFRVYGFYHGPKRREYIALRAHLKRKQKNTARERQVIAEVRRTKDNGDWERIT